eukprot:gene7574-biopygen12273
MPWGSPVPMGRDGGIGSGSQREGIGVVPEGDSVGVTYNMAGDQLRRTAAYIHTLYFSVAVPVRRKVMQYHTNRYRLRVGRAVSHGAEGQRQLTRLIPRRQHTVGSSHDGCSHGSTHDGSSHGSTHGGSSHGCSHDGGAHGSTHGGSSRGGSLGGRSHGRTGLYGVATLSSPSIDISRLNPNEHGIGPFARYGVPDPPDTMNRYMGVLGTLLMPLPGDRSGEPCLPGQLPWHACVYTCNKAGSWMHNHFVSVTRVLWPQQQDVWQAKIREPHVERIRFACSPAVMVTQALSRQQ